MKGEEAVVVVTHLALGLVVGHVCFVGEDIGLDDGVVACEEEVGEFVQVLR